MTSVPRIGTVRAVPTPVTQPPYQRIADHYRRRIRAGDLQPGDRAPSVGEIARKWKVAHSTATRAFNALRDEGLIVTQRARRSVVAERPPA